LTKLRRIPDDADKGGIPGYHPLPQAGDDDVETVKVSTYGIRSGVRCSGRAQSGADIKWLDLIHSGTDETKNVRRQFSPPPSAESRNWRNGWRRGIKKKPRRWDGAGAEETVYWVYFQRSAEFAISQLL